MAKETVLRGKAWVCGDFTDANKILPDQFWKGGANLGSLNAAELGKGAMAGIDPTFGAKALAGEYSFIVAGKNFGGGGKSIEHPIYAIKGAGVKAVIAESFSRYFFRNATNNGLPILVCEGVTGKVKTGDELEVDPSKGEVRNLTTGTTLHSRPMPEIAIKILEAGGYIPYTKQRLAAK
jgi:3-isopropylmalate/(R)-2-methylmalate dehydratase small subunit